MTLVKKRQILKKSGKEGVKYGNSYIILTTGKKNILKFPKIDITTSTRFSCDDRETPAPPTARQNGLRNFIRRVCDEILAEVVLEEQLQSAIYEQIVHQNQRVQTKSIVRRARD